MADKSSAPVQQEWQVVCGPHTDGSNDGQVRRTMSEAMYSILRSQAGDLHRSAATLLQQSARKVLQQHKSACSARCPAWSGNGNGRIIIDRSGASSESTKIPRSNVTRSQRDEAGQAVRPEPNDWEVV